MCVCEHTCACVLKLSNWGQFFSLNYETNIRFYLVFNLFTWETVAHISKHSGAGPLLFGYLSLCPYTAGRSGLQRSFCTLFHGHLSSVNLTTSNSISLPDFSWLTFIIFLVKRYCISTDFVHLVTFFVDTLLGNNTKIIISFWIRGVEYDHGFLMGYLFQRLTSMCAFWWYVYHFSQLFLLYSFSKLVKISFVMYC